jgi:hemoglobin
VSASLYQRLGGATGVAALVDDAVDRHAANPALCALFRGHDLPQLKTLGERFLSAGTGGPGQGMTLDTQAQHVGMGFDPVQLKAVIGDMTDALVEQGVSAVEVGEVLALVKAGNESRTQAA